MPSTVAETFADTARANAAHPFLIVPARADRDWQPAGVEMSYGAALARGRRGCATRYAAAGYGHGHRVALLLENRPEFLLHYLALNGLGVGIVPINPDYRHDEVAYLLEHSEAELAVVLPHRVADVRAAAGDVRQAAAGGRCARPARRAAAALPRRRARASPGLETECALLYTSGTTGPAQGLHAVELLLPQRRRAPICGLGGLIEIRHGQERFYNPLPLYPHEPPRHHRRRRRS